MHGLTEEEIKVVGAVKKGRIGRGKYKNDRK
jgi:hypothetical protein